MAVVIATKSAAGLRGRAVLALCRRRGRWVGERIKILRQRRNDAGMTTAEYAVGTVAACAFAAVLYKVVTSDAVTGMLTALLDRALHAA
ncbi:DUF4244 domain-containing protein [Kitasatospora sp. NPDC050543]|uniref:DUF4244 domain-containing protein n=1 Tax=Kitasatospora sp. NPDC050543 TaxID=3364054 RepID=UPI0037A7BF69